MFSVQHVYAITCFDFVDFVFLEPALVILQLLFKPLRFVLVSTLALAVNQYPDGIVDNVRLLQNPLADVLTAVRAFLLSDQALINALFAKGMATDRRPATDDVVHANRASQSV